MIPETKRVALEEITSPIQADLDRFGQALRQELQSTDPLIQGMHDHILKMTGKFLRPVVTLLCSKLQGKNPEDAVTLAVAVELIHTATLVHDDIIDDSNFRRNQPSVHSRWGRELSIVCGDYLYAKSFMMLASLEDVKINRAFASCAHVMCEGEMKQIEKRKHFDISEEEYLKIIHKKTAALFQASCAGGAYLGSSDLGLAESLGQYGYALGMAFQIVDDCLDLAGDTAVMGKKAGLDIAKSDMTLPLLYILKSLDEPEKTALITAFESESPESVLRRVKDLAASTGALERSMAKARRFADDALRALEASPTSVYRDSLSMLAEYCIERVR